MIGTKSRTTGTVVLHEMGHNFVNVGEEYDGGQAYRGVNSASSATNVGWKHWLTDPSVTSRAEESTLLLQEYPWKDLSEGPVEYTFTSTGSYSRWFLRFTAPGCDSAGSRVVIIDGQRQNWVARGTLDRCFTYGNFDGGFSAGQHTLCFEQGTPPPDRNPIR